MGRVSMKALEKDGTKTVKMIGLVVKLPTMKPS